MPSHTYPASDWRSKSHFGVSIRFWGLCESEEREDFCLIVPETPFARTFIRSLMTILKSDLDIDEDVLNGIGQIPPLANLIVKREGFEGDEEKPPTSEDIVHNNNEEIHSNKLNIYNSTQGGHSNIQRKKAIVITDGTKAPEVTHQVTRKKKNSLYCSTCKVTFDNANSYTEHVCLKAKCCHICGKRFNCNQDLAVHRLIHSHERPHVCETCGQRFRHVQTLKRHRQSLHPGNNKPAFGCNKCGKFFLQRQYLKRHLVSHTGEKPFVCSYCGLQFTQAANVNKHIKTFHLRQSNFICEICGKSFVQLYYLERHIKSTHISTPSQDQDTNRHVESPETLPL